MDECKPLLVGCDDFEIRVFQNEEVIREVTEAERVMGLAHVRGERFGYALGRVVQVDPVKPTLKAPGDKRLKPQLDDMLSNCPFKFNLRHHSWATARWECTTARTGRGGSRARTR